jgi:hypothetical protein
MNPVELHRRVLEILVRHEDGLQQRWRANLVVLLHWRDGASDELTRALGRAAEESTSDGARVAWLKLAEDLLLERGK